MRRAIRFYSAAFLALAVFWCSSFHTNLAARKFSGSTDIITTQYTLAFTKNSWLIYANLNGSGGSSFGRMFDRRDGSQVLEFTFTHDNAASKYTFIHKFSTTNGEWNMTAPATGAWHSYIITYDNSSTANDPVIYQDGIVISATRTAPVGSAQTGGGAIRIGNRNDSTGNWNGDLAHFAFWRNRLLTAQEAYQIGALRRSPLEFSNKLVLYNPIIGGVNKYEKDLVYFAAGIVVGTVGSIGPHIKSYNSWNRRRRLERTAAGTAVPTLINRRRRV